MRVFVALPAHDGRVHVQTARALYNEILAGLVEGVEMRPGFLPGCSILHHARNQLCADFLASDCDKVVFVDTDVAWEAGGLLKLAQAGVDVVGGAYRYKSDDHGYPVAWLEDRAELWADPDTGLLEVQSLPGGLLCISREALVKMREAYPDRTYDFHGHPHYAWFHFPLEGGKLWGEDAAFCRDWRAIGGKLWLQPEIATTHVGLAEYAGHIGQWLRSR